MAIEKPEKPNELPVALVAALVSVVVVYLVITYLLDTFLVRAVLSLAIVGLGYVAFMRRRGPKKG